MDDALEYPTAALKPAQEKNDEDDGHSSGEEDAGVDWTKLSSMNINRPVIPRRGEKEFEPAPGGGSGLQVYVLDRSRSAMFDALRATRSISSKAISYAVWCPSIARAHVTLSRGIHFTSMGHSAPRIQDSTNKVTKRLELLPEEAIYLIERGALFCWKAGEVPISELHQPDDVVGSPMSVQQAFSEMIGTEDMTLERYQVYAYLKRLGYVVTRATAPSSFYPVTPPTLLSNNTTPTLSFITRVRAIFSQCITRLWKVAFSSFNWWRPLCINPWLHSHMNHRFVYRSLRLISSGYAAPLHAEFMEKDESSPYRIFYHLYKPSTVVKKTSPPPPDFCVVVVNARTTNMPTLQELCALFGEMPELPPPLPRQRQPPNKTITSPVTVTPSQRTLLSRIFPWLFRGSEIQVLPPRKPNPFAALKAGKKIVVVAAVDAGNISFYRFGQGAFEEWPMI